MNSLVVAGIALAVLAVALAWPVPVLLARAHWAIRDPLAALILWQAIGLAGGLSMIGAGLVYAVSDLSATFPSAVGALVAGWLHGSVVLDPVHLILVGLAAVLAVRLLVVLVISVVRTGRHRRRHRRLLDVLSEPSRDRPGARLLDHQLPVAYCLPGPRNTMVLSAGIVRLLSKTQLDAVIAHERAHLVWRHDILVLPFVSWRRALPWLRAATAAHCSVMTLIEMLADDIAVQSVDSRVLAGAITLVDRNEPPPGGLALAARATTLRVRRLTNPPGPLPFWLRALVFASASALLAVPVVALFVPFAE